MCSIKFKIRRLGCSEITSLDFSSRSAEHLLRLLTNTVQQALAIATLAELLLSWTQRIYMMELVVYCQSLRQAHSRNQSATLIRNERYQKTATCMQQRMGLPQFMNKQEITMHWMERNQKVPMLMKKRIIIPKQLMKSRIMH